MTTTLIVLLGIALMALAFLLGRQHRRHPQGARLSPVSRQHIALFQGQQLNETVVESVKVRFRDLLERGQAAAVEASLRPGTHYVFQIRALAEIGTESAGKILEGQLQRRLTDDPLEQYWYWIDLASSLRLLNRQESLPHLLRCAEAGDSPLGPFFAAETICFLGFSGYLRQFDAPLGRSALRLVHRVLEGLRCDLPPHVATEARLGEMIEDLWDHRPRTTHPQFVRIAHAIVRLLRRTPHVERLMGEESMEHEALNWQISRLAALEPALLEYLQKAPRALLDQLPHAKNRHELLQALLDMRVDTGAELLPMLARPDFGPIDKAIEVLAWSKHADVGPWLRRLAVTQVPMGRRAQTRRRFLSPSRPSLPGSVPYRAILRALRGHAGAETERFLILAARDFDPVYRQAACSSLSWWEPMQRFEVLECLNECCVGDQSAEVRQAARAALARLGERRSLHWFRHALTAEDSDNVHEAMHLIAAENLFLLWPDLDRLADSENLDIAHHARETLECLSEDLDRR